jgi:hypothetical protein
VEIVLDTKFLIHFKVVLCHLKINVILKSRCDGLKAAFDILAGEDINGNSEMEMCPNLP